MLTRGAIGSKSFGLMAGCSLIILMPGFAHAQQAPAHPPTAAEPEIVVTAQKRVERLLDVPISETAITGATLARSGRNNIRDLKFAIPNFTSYSNINYNQYVIIRGFNSQTGNIGFESSLGLYVDGVFLGRNESTAQELADIDSIEVLRGPQGTLFGKNSTIGALLVNTKRPTNELSGAASAEIGNYNERRLTGFIAGPLLRDKLYAKISGFYNEHDGYTTNVNSTGPRRLDDDKTGGARGELRFTPTSTLDISLRGDWSRSRSHPLDLEIVSTPPAGPFVGVADGNPLGVPLDNIIAGKRTVSINAPDNNTLQIYGGSLTADWTIGDGYKLTAISAYRRLKSDLDRQDGDDSPHDYLQVSILDQTYQLTQELRLASPARGRFRFVAGAYYYNQVATTDRAYAVGSETIALFGLFGVPPALFDPNTILVHGRVKTESIAAFGNATFDITDKLQLFGGLRYTHETKRLQASQRSIPLLALYDPTDPTSAPIYPDVPGGSDRISDNDLSPTAGVSYKPNNRTTIYAKYSKGFKSGGWNVDLFGPGIGAATTTSPYDASDQQLSRVRFKPESIENYEIGMKAELFDRRLRVNLAGFHQAYSDIQVSQFLGGLSGFIIRNAGRATSNGFEAELTGRPLNGLDLGGTVGFADAKYDRYRDGCGLGCNLDGQRLDAPRWTASISGQYTHPLSHNLDGVVRADWSYRGDHPGLSPLQDMNGKVIYPLPVSANSTLDGRIGIQAAAGWSVFLYARNLLNSNYIAERQLFTSNALLQVQQVGETYGAPRTYGVRLDYKF